MLRIRIRVRLFGYLALNKDDPLALSRPSHTCFPNGWQGVARGNKAFVFGYRQQDIQVLEHPIFGVTIAGLHNTWAAI